MRSRGNYKLQSTALLAFSVDHADFSLTNGCEVWQYKVLIQRKRPRASNVPPKHHVMTADNRHPRITVVQL